MGARLARPGAETPARRFKEDTMRLRWLLVLAGLLLAASSARAQVAGSFFIDPNQPGRYFASRTFGFSSLPAGFSDTVNFTAPVDGALTIDLAFRPIVGTNVIPGMFQLVRLDDMPLPLTGPASHVTSGPIDIEAGEHGLEIIAAIPFPHGVSLPGPSATAFDLTLTLIAVPAIPEPGAWALMLGGMVATWVAVRRRRPPPSLTPA
jgi:hypothetical protein